MPAVGEESGIPFGNYTLLRRIARGGMAEVFVARQKGIDGFDRLVAIKRILPHLLDDQSFVGMFQEEARLAARLSHPNIIHIYDFGKVEEHFFIAMEFVHGLHAGDLIRLAGEELMPMALVARIGADACAGLHYAHNRRDPQGTPLQLVHRDVSPPNLLVSYDGVVKIVDFGIAKAVNSIEQTRPGVVKGKYAFMSPEQTMGRGLDGRSDVFSLAIVLWELLSGKPAVTRTDQILAMQTLRDGKVGAIEEARESIPQDLARAFENALRKNPKKRSSAREFGNALESFIQSSDGIATSMVLGAWLTQRVPPEQVLRNDKNVLGTRPATMATSHVLDPRALDPHILDPMGMDHQVTKIQEVSGALRAQLAAETKLVSIADSVVIDEDALTGSRAPLDPTSAEETEHVLQTSELVELGFEDERGNKKTGARKLPTSRETLDAIEPSPPRRGGLRIAALLALGATALLGIDWWRNSSQAQHSVVGDAGHVPTPPMLVTPLLDASAAHDAAPRTAHDAAPSPTLPPLAIDAGIADATVRRPKPPHKKKTKQKKTKQKKPDNKELGRLTVRTSPYSVVYHRGKRLGTTPMANLALAPGRYRLVFKNPKFGKRSKSVVIRAGRTTKIDFALDD